MTFATGLAITAGYHRLFSHKTYDAKWPYRLFMLLFGAAAFENTALRWSSDHRNHHKFVDTDQDPYNIKRGFFYAHMGWVMLRYDNEHRYDNVADLERDPLVMFQHKHYVWLGILVGLVFPTLFAAMWGDWFGGLFFAGIFRTVMNQHFTFCINSFAHLFGSRPYSDQNTSRDNWFLAFLTYGEGYHNYHHKFPADYRNGIQNYHWDPTKWLIKGLEHFGQTTNLRKTPNETILRAKLKMDEQRILKKIQNGQPIERHIPQELVVSSRQKIEEAYAHFLKLKEEYYRLKQEKIHSFHVQVAHLNERLNEIKAEIRKAQERFHLATLEWRKICGRAGVSSPHLVFNS
ncbi:MAG: hypothetical protein KCHDKBKB_01457 [Elusimicrobia bacterium]|nr:hypothetical protein [Elusimicrobiota bacterium]